MKNTEITVLFKTIADSFQALSDIYSSTEDAPQSEATAKKEKPTKVSEKEPATNTPAETDTEVKAYTKEEVRAMLSQKAKFDGCKYKAEVKAIVAKYSEDGTLTNVPEDKYRELMADLEVVGNA
jgi:hypothetical protein